MTEKEARSGDLDKLEWMYKGPGNSVDREEYLLGKAVSSSSTLVGVKNEVERDCLPTPLLSNNTSVAVTGSLITDQVDIARKIHEDPLLAIKKKEIEKREQLLKNPVKMKKLQDMLKRQKAKQSRLAEGRKKTKKKKGKKESIDDDSDDSDLDKVLKNKYKKLKMKLGLDDLSNLSKEKKQKSSKIVKHRDKTKKSNKKVSDVSKRRSSSSNKHKKRHRKEVSSSSESSSSSSDSSDSSDDSSSDCSTSSSESDTDSDNKSTKKVHSRKKKSRTTTGMTSKSSKIYGCKSNLKHDSTDSDTKSIDLGQGEDGSKKYGLLLPPGKTDSNAKKRAEESEPKRSSKMESRGTNSVQTKYVKANPVKLSEAEKEERRREMMKNAEWRNDLRNKNVKKYKEKDEKEKKKEKEYSDDFYRKQLSYAASQGSVEGRIKSNIYRIQRTASEMDKNFARR